MSTKSWGGALQRKWVCVILGRIMETLGTLGWKNKVTRCSKLHPPLLCSLTECLEKFQDGDLTSKGMEKGMGKASKGSLNIPTNTIWAIPAIHLNFKSMEAKLFGLFFRRASGCWLAGAENTPVSLR